MPRRFAPLPATSAMTSPLRLGQLLLREGLVSREHVDMALCEQKDGSALPLGRLLVQQGAIDEATLAHVLARQFGLPLVDLDAEAPEPDALASLPREAAFQLQALPLRHEGDRLVVVVAEPPTRGLRQALAQSTREAVRFAVAPADHLAHALTLAYPGEVTRKGDAGRSGDPAPLPAGEHADDASQLSTPGAEAPDGDRVVMWLLARAIDLGATAVHLEGEPGGLRVRWRGESAKEEDLRLPAAAGATLVGRVLLAAGLDPAVTSPQAGAFRAAGAGLAHDVRVTSAQTRTGSKVVVRLDPGDGVGLGL